MGDGPVGAPGEMPPPSWGLEAPHDAQTQGMVVSGFSDQPWAQALFLSFDWPADGGPGKGAWLKILDGVAPITSAGGKAGRPAAIAFTCSGLRKLGLPPEALATFLPAFQEGMLQKDRLRRLGDTSHDTWSATVIDGGPQWSGNTAAPDDAPSTAPPLTTPKTVHALLLLYDKDETDCRNWAQDVESKLAPHQVSVVHRLSLDLRCDENGIAREHFGFADGLSQPIPFGDSVVRKDGKGAVQDFWHGVPLGEILLGHTNAHHEKAPGPVVSRDAKGDPAQLPADGAPEGFFNLGLDGSYMVVRELRQDVAAFWNSLEAGAEAIRKEDPGATHVTADWLAEKVVGRNRDGHLLCPGGFLPGPAGQPRNAVGFMPKDRYGYGCPRGSHVRRANPRNGLAPDEAAARTLLDAANNHRILRRGRKFGTTIADRRTDDQETRGLLFMCLNTDLVRQFEFVQQTWILNQNFATLYDETDPLVGPKGPFTIAEEPLRRTVTVATFIRMAGGEYFFLPSMPALNYLKTL